MNDAYVHNYHMQNFTDLQLHYSHEAHKKSGNCYEIHPYRQQSAHGSIALIHKDLIFLRFADRAAQYIYLSN